MYVVLKFLQLINFRISKKSDFFVNHEHMNVWIMLQHSPVSGGLMPLPSVWCSWRYVPATDIILHAVPIKINFQIFWNELFGMYTLLKSHILGSVSG